MKSELGLLKSVLQGSEKQPAKEARKDFDRQEKLLPACDPTCAVRRKAAAWHDAVQKKPSRKILRRMEQIEKLPAAQQALLLKTIDTFIKAASK